MTWPGTCGGPTANRIPRSYSTNQALKAGCDSLHRKNTPGDELLALMYLRMAVAGHSWRPVLPMMMSSPAPN